MIKGESLEKLYEITKELAPSHKYKEINKTFVREREEFLKKIGKGNRENFERLIDIQNDMNNELIKQAFNNGFKMATKLFIETIGK